MTEISEKEVRAVADVLLGRVNAPEQEIYRAARDGLEAAARVRAEANAGGPVAWGEDIDGKIVSVRLDKSRHCTVPLYRAPQPSRPVGVKPLKWDDHPAGGQQAIAAGLGLYRVHANGDDWYLVPDHMGKGGRAAAQADYERRILSALTAGKPEQAVPSGWQPIETAPKDGTEFQVWIEKYGWEPRARFNPDSEAFELWGRVDYDKDAWDVYPHMVPTHWMPLPTPPTTGGGE